MDEHDEIGQGHTAPDGASALITGCNSGFGYATALHFARRGVRVFASVRNLSKGEALRRVAAVEDLPLELVELDVTDESSCAGGLDRVLGSTGGRLDALVNNAGMVFYAAVEETSTEEAERIFAVNVHGPLRMMRLALPAMRAAGRGAVVNVSSVNGIVCLPYSGIYGASKWALEGASQAARLELEPFGVRVALVQPAGFNTAIADNSPMASLPHPGSPYWEGTEAMRAASRAANSAAPDLTPVAEAIWAAAFGTSPRFRWPVGIHAELLSEMRAEMTDEEFLHVMATGASAAMEQRLARRTG